MLTTHETQELTDFALWLNEHGFTDGTDASPVESLVEYGLLRNPTTGFVVYAVPADVSEITTLDWTIIHIDDVKDYLQDAPNGFYGFLGSDRQTEIARLDNKYLAGIIFAANQYTGEFEQSCTWTSTIEGLKRQIGT